MTMEHVRALCLGMLAAAMAGCGDAVEERGAGLPPGVARIGTTPAHRPGGLSAASRSARTVGELTCARERRRVLTVHLELFAHGEVVVVPAGIGVAPPRVRDGAYVRGGSCRYPLWTEEPTGLVDAARAGLTLGDLFAIWGRPLGEDRLAGFRAPVRAWLGGRRWPRDPRAIPLTRHAQIVVQAGAPVVTPHAAYRFPPGR